VLKGRERERALVAALVDEAWAGRGGALVLHGQPGVGKSALLAETVATTPGLTVLRTQGVESESPLAFAALQRLLRPVMGCAERIPSPQAQALRAAFGESTEPVTDRFLVFLAALSLLAEAAEHQPVLAVVDDAHWLDDASAAALLFVARRLQVERVALLFAARDGDVRTFDGGDLPGALVGGVDAEAAGDLLSERAGVPVPDTVRDALLASTGGNPLALVELSDALSNEHLAGSRPLPARLPLTEGVERAFLARYRRLHADAQMLLLVAAADDSGRLLTVSSAAAQLGAGEDALAAVERSGLMRVQDDVLDLHHPLVRSAVYGAATSTDRRRAHRALAAVLARTQDADRRAWHLAASVTEPDPAVVAELDGVAERAQQRGGLEAAAAAWERAAELTPSGDERAQRLYRAARSAWLAAEPARARTLAEAAAVQARDAGLLADVQRLRARIEWNTGSLHVGHRMVLQAAADVAHHDHSRAREMAMFAAALAAFGAESGTGLDPTALVPPPPSDAPARARCFSDLLYGLHAVAGQDWARATAHLCSAFTLADELEDDDLDLLPNLGIAALHLGADELGLRFHQQLLTRARSTGAAVMILYALTRRAFFELATGAWTSAATGATEALALARNTGHAGLAGLPTAVLAVLAARRGDHAAGREHLAALDLIVGARPLGILSEVVADQARWARGLLETTASAELHQYEQINHPTLRRLAAIDRIEAAVRAQRHDTARAWVQEVREFAEATGSAWAQAVTHHGLALLAAPSDAAGHFERALGAHDRSPRRPARARTELAFGEYLRRARRRIDARVHLRAALDTFEDLGAERWAERARQELRASGETARRRDVPTSADLTPQELQVARLVQQGMSNRDVAGQLFVSPRTVDFHLRNVFSKLGITSRMELATLALG
jgi:DNA-binding CsgD family transcriptional regulator